MLEEAVCVYEIFANLVAREVSEESRTARKARRMLGLVKKEWEHEVGGNDGEERPGVLDFGSACFRRDFDQLLKGGEEADEA